MLNVLRRWMGSAAVSGACLGAVVLVPFIPALTQPALAQPAGTTTAMPVDQFAEDQAAFINVQLTAWASLYGAGDTRECCAWWSVDGSGWNGNAVYTLRNQYGDSVSALVDWDAPVPTNDPLTTVHAVVALLSGPVGSVPVAAAFRDTVNTAGVHQRTMTLMRLLTTSEWHTFDLGARVRDTPDGTVYRLRAPNTTPEQQASCIAGCQLSFNQAANTALAVLTAALYTATITWAAAMTFCAIEATVPGIGLFLASTCVFKATILYVAAFAAATIAFGIMMAALTANLRLCLLGCGAGLAES